MTNKIQLRGWSFVLLTLIFACSTPYIASQQRFSSGTVPPAEFADPRRVQKLALAFPEIDRLFASFVERAHMPGAVYGIIVDGELVWIKTTGVKERRTNAAVTPDTVFRIASMTKSFTALAIMKLRDDGKLSLDDSVAKYVPALAGLPYPTKDSPVLTIRHLLTHSEGFPEDNPWGDRQLAQPDKTMDDWMRAGIPFSTAPGTAFEYSNYGFAILGQIVAAASKQPYDKYVHDKILIPLGMTSSFFEKTQVPADRIALGYRYEDNTWKEEPILAHGSFGAMGGLWTTTRDLSRYVSFYLAAFPPRDDADPGPVKRSSVREMQQAARQTPASAFRATVDSPLSLGVSSYAFGLGVSQDCRFTHTVGHGGGLPGYGSLMQWLPEYGVGLIAMSNRTYGGFGGFFPDAFAVLHRTGALQPRVVKPSPALLAAKKEISDLILKWDESLANRIAADNLFLDVAADVRSTRWRELVKEHGNCQPAETIEAENALRGRWRMRCERGWFDVSITLAPTTVPTVQFINIAPVLPPDDAMSKMIQEITKLVSSRDLKALESLAGPGLDVNKVNRQISAMSPWGACKPGELLGGNGTSNSAIRLMCDGGPVAARISVDSATHKLTDLNLTPLREQRCVP